MCYLHEGDNVLNEAGDIVRLVTLVDGHGESVGAHASEQADVPCTFAHIMYTYIHVSSGEAKNIEQKPRKKRVDSKAGEGEGDIP